MKSREVETEADDTWLQVSCGRSNSGRMQSQAARRCALLESEPKFNLPEQ